MDVDSFFERFYKYHLVTFPSLFFEKLKYFIEGIKDKSYFSILFIKSCEIIFLNKNKYTSNKTYKTKMKT